MKINTIYQIRVILLKSIEKSKTIQKSQEVSNQLDELTKESTKYKNFKPNPTEPIDLLKLIKINNIKPKIAGFQREALNRENRFKIAKLE